jgi:hypothetical protein
MNGKTAAQRMDKVRPRSRLSQIHENVGSMKAGWMAVSTNVGLVVVGSTSFSGQQSVTLWSVRRHFDDTKFETRFVKVCTRVVESDMDLDMEVAPVFLGPDSTTLVWSSMSSSDCSSLLFMDCDHDCMVTGRVRRLPPLTRADMRRTIVASDSEIVFMECPEVQNSCAGVRLQLFRRTPGGAGFVLVGPLRGFSDPPRRAMVLRLHHLSSAGLEVSLTNTCTYGDVTIEVEHWVLHPTRCLVQERRVVLPVYGGDLDKVVRTSSRMCTMGGSHLLCVQDCSQREPTRAVVVPLSSHGRPNSPAWPRIRGHKGSASALLFSRMRGVAPVAGLGIVFLVQERPLNSARVYLVQDENQKTCAGMSAYRVTWLHSVHRGMLYRRHVVLAISSKRPKKCESVL